MQLSVRPSFIPRSRALLFDSNATALALTGSDKNIASLAIIPPKDLSAGVHKFALGYSQQLPHGGREANTPRLFEVATTVRGLHIEHQQLAVALKKRAYFELRYRTEAQRMASLLTLEHHGAYRSAQRLAASDDTYAPPSGLCGKPPKSILADSRVKHSPLALSANVARNIADCAADLLEAGRWRLEVNTDSKLPGVPYRQLTPPRSARSEWPP